MNIFGNPQKLSYVTLPPTLLPGFCSEKRYHEIGFIRDVECGSQARLVCKIWLQKQKILWGGIGCLQFWRFYNLYNLEKSFLHSRVLTTITKNDLPNIKNSNTPWKGGWERESKRTVMCVTAAHPALMDPTGEGGRLPGLLCISVLFYSSVVYREFKRDYRRTLLIY